MGLLYEQLNHYAYWLRLKKNAIKSVFLEGYTNTETNIYVKEQRCVGITPVYKTLAMLHAFLLPLESFAMAKSKEAHPDMMDKMIDIYFSNFTNNAQKILTERVHMDGFNFFDRLTFSEIMHVIRSCYTYGAMINGSSFWLSFLECLKFKLAHILSDVFDDVVLDVPHLRNDITDTGFNYETNIVKKIIYQKKRTQKTLKDNIKNDKKTPFEVEKKERPGNVCDEKTVDYVDTEALEQESYILSATCDSSSKKKTTIVDEDLCLLSDTNNSMIVETKVTTTTCTEPIHLNTEMIEEEEKENTMVDVQHAVEDMHGLIAGDDDGGNGDADGITEDEDGESLWMGNDAAHLYYGFFSSFSVGYFGEMTDIPKKKLFDLHIFDKYDTETMKRKIKCHHDLSLFFKIWSGFKLLNPSNVLRTEIRNKYVAMHVSRDDVNWFLCEGDLLDLKRRLTTDPERMLDKMYAMMAKQIKDDGSKNPFHIYKDCKNNSAYRGFMDWLRLYTATSCISVDVDKFFTKMCSKTLHYEQWISSKGITGESEDKKWFEQRHFPFIYMHNGRYNIFYNGQQLLRNDVPLALVQTVEYLISKSLEISSCSIDFDINFENHENIKKMQSFWIDVTNILKKKDRRDLLKYDVDTITNMTRALYIVANASKVLDVHCYDNGKYLETFENICAHYYKKNNLEEKLIYSSLFNRTLSNVSSIDPEHATNSESSEFAHPDVTNDLDHVFLNRIIHRNFNCCLYADTTTRSNIPDVCERKDRFKNNMSNTLSYLNCPKYDCDNVLDCLFDIGDNMDGYLDNNDTAYETLATWVMLCLEYNDNPELKKKIKFGLVGSIKNIIHWYYEKSVYTNEDVSDRMQKGEVDESVLKEDKRRAEKMEREALILRPETVYVFYHGANHDLKTNDTKKKILKKEKKEEKKATTTSTATTETNNYILYEDDFEAFSRQDIGVYMKSQEQMDFLNNLKRCIEIFKNLQNSVTNYDYIYKR
jgi:hypothetical protein